MSHSTTAPRSRTWKAAGAAGIALALLAGGGATFAEWSDSQELGTHATITAGTLALDANEERSWTNAADADVTEAVDAGTYRIVPGDSLTYAQSVVIEATGDLMQATVSTALPTVTGTEGEQLLGLLAAGATMSIDGEQQDGLSATVGSSEQDRLLDVAVTLTFDSQTTGLVAQGQSVNLGTMAIDLTQQAVTATN